MQADETFIQLQSVELSDDADFHIHISLHFCCAACN